MRTLSRFATPLALVAGLIALLAGLPHAGTPGWDASGHALAGLRMAEALADFDLSLFFDQFLRTELYPPLGRLGLGVGSLIGGASFAAARAASCVAWILALAVAARLARRLVTPQQSTAASLSCVLFGLTSWVGAVHAREAYLESFSALAVSLALLAWVRALEVASFRRAFVCGLALGGAFLVKTPYGLQVIAVIGLVGLLDLLSPAEQVAGVRRALGVGAGLGLVLSWWFLLPLPHGTVRGNEHWGAFLTHLTTAATQSSHGRGYLFVAWPLMSYLSLPAFGLQLCALVWAALKWRERIPRVLLVAALVGPLAFWLYPFRLDRFLMPTLPAAWALAGGLCAAVIARVPGPRRWGLALATLLLCIASSGLGAERLTRLAFPSLPPQLPAEARANLKALQNPYAFRRAPAAGPQGTEAILRFAREHLLLAPSFTWIGGTTRELPLALFQWSLFAAGGPSTPLWKEPAQVDHLWTDPGWDEAAFRKWAAAFAFIGTLDPPDPLDRKDRAFEARFVAWMAQHPGFELLARREVTLESTRVHVVSIYERR